MSAEELQSMELVFTITDDEGKDFELIPNGKDIKITKENIHKYVSLCTQYKFRDSILPQLEAFQKGFQTVVSTNVILFFFHFLIF